MLALAGLEEMELAAWARVLLHGARVLAILAAGAGAYIAEKREQEKWGK